MFVGKKREVFMKSKTIMLLILFLSIKGVYAEDYSCEVLSDQILIKKVDQVVSSITTSGSFDCLIFDNSILIARGAEGIDVYKLQEKKNAEKISNIKTYAEAIRFRIENNKIYIITATYSQLPLIKKSDGTYALYSLSDELFKKRETSSLTTLTGENSRDKKIERKEGKVLEVTPGYAIVNLGSKDGIVKNMRFEIQSSELKKTYNLKTKSYEMMPSLEVTAISPVVQVSEETCMIRIGRGNRAYIGDIAILTDKPLSESIFTPSYEKNLHRIYGRIAPFVGIETLTIGSLLSVMYDYTFSFPLKIETGLKNAGILFSTKNTSPFEIDLIPSYNTDLFEIGLGTGYSYSGHQLQSNFLFLQKVRLGAIDGINFTMWNSFIYQEKHSNWTFVGLDEISGGIYKEGDPCQSPAKREYEFGWNGFDMEASVPVSKYINLFTHWAFSQAGWISGEIGIKNFVKGNGGDGTLIIPVSIGGTAVVDYKKEVSHNLICNPDTNEMEYEKVWDEEVFGGPIVSIGLDYRWK